MSRIGKKPIQIPEGVKINLEGEVINISGLKGEISYRIPSELSVEVKDEVIRVIKKSNTLFAQKIYGLFARLITNGITGVSIGWKKTLALIGTGYRARLEDKTLVLALGFSHPVKFNPAQGISFSIEENKITVSGLDKYLVGQTAANIRAARPPEPYQGKGVRYENEYVRRKAGKSAKVGGKA
ncbi:MAG: 50S ribosomal protein L6 [Candidatus Blackburnbacteria bacterium RIFCSPHIGHO2_01_FULL_44_64]|uniref:Large ribosomal subunit protein uL6 n=1 Tax=Candidatus Blackburnbacteria bacterium RIFCSPHIGHO2_02_FULL_44_20 TaxID=1797516 RepID=A0A1G1VA93_9BACT|nr:MAG: 50S ribosomal protein L6 [Candidatus Blackburnbacteria bacterium RIFCSPHIGHO2_01_FULL_44_64]OGY11825.1 MAG: 50S ribosomal protein L6 [Candidatus Blackburnbacteria bacterium RIFCSPHIGHO2_12_FULL_44_25]OGY12370.1 MAG: 50S ribosomal protein L6 [Candidatus Blackburnbacteria bacterium RIFCSPHIGHO2_02_FULL_44_20]OGY15075.1 MAG: 50S ribosomal protein L6 [Candidatus Blackburnbacteria bacterium RIFCSPLOWO2_01_FULL_44_43]OGY16014.1 MAG: 50S ribosomal protein L6 [Candidatus Blackburnbacteria bacte